MGEDGKREMDACERGRDAALGELPLRGRVSTAEAVAAFVVGCEARGLRPRTVLWYGWMLRPLAARFEVLPVAPAALEQLLAGLGDVSDVTRLDYWVVLRVFYRWAAVRFGFADPLQAIRRPLVRRRVPLALTEAQVLRVLAAAVSRRDKALLTLLLDTGMRLGEAHSLTWSDVGVDVLVVDGKVGRRQVPISSWALWVLMGVELPWRSTRGGDIGLDGLGRAVRRCLRRAGVAKGGPHLLRHTFARLYLRAGGDVFSLQRILGHR